MWLMYVFGVLVVVTSGSAFFSGAIWPGIAGLIGPVLCWWAGSGVRGSFHVGTRGQKVGGAIAGLVLLATGLGLLYASGYLVRLFSIQMEE